MSPSPRASATVEQRTAAKLARRPSSARTSADGDAVWQRPGKPPTPPPGFPPLADDEPGPQPDSSRPPATKPAARPAAPFNVNDAAGGLLALLVWPLVLNYLRHGPAGPKAWLRAKFLNDPTSF